MKVKRVHKSQECATTRCAVYTFYINSTKFTFFLVASLLHLIDKLKLFLPLPRHNDFNLMLLKEHLGSNAQCLFPKYMYSREHFDVNCLVIT